jgi:glycosyltransferase involved in cell wall biosynthesis
MVQALVEGLPLRGIPVHHVNLRLSQDTSDIGHWQFSKVVATIACAIKAVRARFRHKCDTLYYVPAPPNKRAALYRDWMLMLLCRPFFARCVFHWHAGGLGQWIAAQGFVERGLTKWLLGRVHLSIVLAESLRADAQVLRPRRVAVVPNGVAIPSAPPRPTPGGSFRLFFLGLCSEEKGLFSAAAAVLEANRRLGAGDPNPAFLLTVAGPFDRGGTADKFHRICGEHPNVIRYAGKVGGPHKSALFAECHALLFPTRYSAETLSLVALEALAHDRPVVATTWRGLPDIVTADVGVLVPPANDAALAAALLRLREHPPTPGVCRTRFLTHFTLERHLTLLTAALSDLDKTRS